MKSVPKQTILILIVCACFTLWQIYPPFSSDSFILLACGQSQGSGLHLASYGDILLHADNISASGTWIIGVSLGEQILKMTEAKGEKNVAVYLQRLSIMIRGLSLINVIILLYAIGPQGRNTVFSWKGRLGLIFENILHRLSIGISHHCILTPSISLMIHTKLFFNMFTIDHRNFSCRPESDS